MSQETEKVILNGKSIVQFELEKLSKDGPAENLYPVLFNKIIEEIGKKKSKWFINTTSHCCGESLITNPELITHCEKTGPVIRYAVIVKCSKCSEPGIRTMMLEEKMALEYDRS